MNATGRERVGTTLAAVHRTLPYVVLALMFGAFNQEDATTSDLRLRFAICILLLAISMAAGWAGRRLAGGRRCSRGCAGGLR